MARNRLHRIIENYTTKCLRKHGRQLNRFLDVWGWNGLKSGPNPWYVHEEEEQKEEDDDDDEYDNEDDDNDDEPFK